MEPRYLAYAKVNRCTVNHQKGECSPGAVYVIRFGNFVHIGQTSSVDVWQGVERRIKHYERKLDMKSELCYYLLTSCAGGLERHIFSRQMLRHVQGEWFVYDEEAISQIAKIKGFNGSAVIPVWEIGDRSSFLKEAA